MPLRWPLPRAAHKARRGRRVPRGARPRVLGLCMASTALLPRHDDGLVGDDAPPPTAEPPLLITIPETARLLSCNAGLVKLMIRRGELQPVKLGRLTRIPRAQLPQKDRDSSSEVRHGARFAQGHGGALPGRGKGS
jgi:excisionase family DNA binding protein